MKVIVRKVKLNSFLQASGDPKIKNLKYFPGSKTVIMAPLDKRNGEFPVTGLTPEDERRLEKALGLPENKLARSSDYWKTYSVTITEDGLELDTTIPTEELMYKILGKSTLVAKSLGELSTNPDAEFVMSNDDQEAEQSNRKREARMKAYSLLNDWSLEEYQEYLIAKGERDVHTISPARIRDKVSKEAEDSPRKFLSFVEDPNYKTRILITELVMNGILKIQGTRYYDVAGEQTIGANIDQVIDYVTDPKNQTVLLTLKKALEAKKRGVELIEDPDTGDLVLDKTKPKITKK